MLDFVRSLGPKNAAGVSGNPPEGTPWQPTGRFATPLPLSKGLNQSIMDLKLFQSAGLVKAKCQRVWREAISCGPPKNSWSDGTVNLSEIQAETWAP